jgi:hypothetical protein
VAPGSSTPTASTTPTAPATPVPTGSTPTTPGTTGIPAPGAASTVPTVPTTTAPATTTPGLPSTLSASQSRHKPHESSKRLSGLALVLAILGALLVLACLVWAITRWLALEPRWSTGLMYSLREATYRASATWAEFSDWARIGH